MTFEEIQFEARRLVKDHPEPTETEFRRMDELIDKVQKMMSQKDQSNG